MELSRVDQSLGDDLVVNVLGDLDSDLHTWWGEDQHRRQGKVESQLKQASLEEEKEEQESSSSREEGGNETRRREYRRTEHEGIREHRRQLHQETSESTSDVGELDLVACGRRSEGGS